MTKMPWMAFFAELTFWQVDRFTLYWPMYIHKIHIQLMLWLVHEVD